MQRMEKVALESSPVSVRCLKRYVDDSDTCLKQSDVLLFHQHLNSINPHIQFTIKMPIIDNATGLMSNTSDRSPMEK